MKHEYGKFQGFFTVHHLQKHKWITISNIFSELTSSRFFFQLSLKSVIFHTECSNIIVLFYDDVFQNAVKQRTTQWWWGGMPNIQNS